MSGILDHSTPLGLELRKERAISLLKKLYAETLRDAGCAALNKQSPSAPNAFELYCLEKDERLALFNSVVEMFEKLPTSTVIAKGEE